MLLMENIRMAFTSLMANKTRALLTMLGIIIGIASVIAIMTVGNSLTLSVSSEMQSIGANNISVYVTSRQTQKDEQQDGITFGTVEPPATLTQEDLISDQMIANLMRDFSDSVEAVSIENSAGRTTIKSGSKSASINLDGVNQGYFVSHELQMVAGKCFTQRDEAEARQVCVVDKKFVDTLYDGNYEGVLGREITAEINNTQFPLTIIGVYEQSSGGLMSMDSMFSPYTTCYLPLATTAKLLHSKNYYSIDVITKTGIDGEEFSSKIQTYFEGLYRSNPSFTVESFSMSSMMSSLNSMMGTITMAISIIAGIALLVGGIGVMNIMLVSITERTREIGTRKALGATNSSIRIQFITESMIICLIGGAIGVVLGIAMGALAAKLMGFPASPTISSIIGSLLFSLAIGVFFGYYPANKAAKMNPIEALRYE